MSTSNTHYLGPFLTSQSTSTESNVQQVMPIAGTVANLAVKLANDPSEGDSYTFTIRKNGNGASGGTTVSCKIENTNTSCNSAANSVTFAQGDLLSLQIVPASDRIARARSAGGYANPVALQVQGEARIWVFMGAAA